MKNSNEKSQWIQRNTCDLHDPEKSDNCHFSIQLFFKCLYLWDIFSTCTDSCNDHCNQYAELFHQHKETPSSMMPSYLPFPIILATSHAISSSTIEAFQGSHNMQLLWYRLFLLSHCHPSHCKYGKFGPFYCWVVQACVYWQIMSFSDFGYKQNRYEHSRTGFCVNIVFLSVRKMLMSTLLCVVTTYLHYF